MPTTHGWTAKRFFLSEKKTAKMVKARRDGLSFRELEEKFHLKPMRGMSAYRIVVRWARKSATKQEAMRERIRARIKDGQAV